MNFTVVLGVDKKTIESLRLVWPTWRRFKPSLMSRPFVIFYNGVTEDQILSVIVPQWGDGDSAGYAPAFPANIKLVPWPPRGVEYPRDGATKWTNPQRAMMLAGFVHVPVTTVETPYWLKLDLDAVAIGMDDWVDPTWFEPVADSERLWRPQRPSIIAPGWNYSKPAQQMLALDEWAACAKPWFFDGTAPLDLRPEPGSEIVRHQRICSWCAFFHTTFTIECSHAATQSCGRGQIPVDSQDGFHFYCAHRGRFSIRRVPMKQYGWKVRHSVNAVRDTVREIMS